MTEIYLHIVARMADYMATHPYYIPVTVGDLSSVRCVRMRCWCLLVCCVRRRGGATGAHGGGARAGAATGRCAQAPHLDPALLVRWLLLQHRARRQTRADWAAAGAGADRATTASGEKRARGDGARFQGIKAPGGSRAEGTGQSRAGVAPDSARDEAAGTLVELIMPCMTDIYLHV